MVTKKLQPSHTEIERSLKVFASRQVPASEVGYKLLMAFGKSQRDIERYKEGIHYTSVPNIMKVINPLFMNELREDYNRLFSLYKQKKNLLDMSAITATVPAHWWK